MTYPCWRYHKSGAKREITDPDQEPKGEDWRDKPWPPPPQPLVLNDCCLKVKERFDEQWKELVAENEALKAERDNLQTLADNLTALQAGLEKKIDQQEREQKDLLAANDDLAKQLAAAAKKKPAKDAA
jgi:hypothetical protein